MARMGTIGVGAVLELDEVGVMEGDELRGEDDKIGGEVGAYLV